MVTEIVRAADHANTYARYNEANRYQLKINCGPLSLRFEESFDSGHVYACLRKCRMYFLELT